MLHVKHEPTNMHYTECLTIVRKFVRALCEHERRTLHDKRAGCNPKQCVGGLMICADLAQALNRVPRGRMQEAMEDAGFSSDEVAVLMLFHTQSHCNIQQ